MFGGASVGVSLHPADPAIQADKIQDESGEDGCQNSHHHIDLSVTPHDVSHLGLRRLRQHWCCNEDGYEARHEVKERLTHLTIFFHEVYAV
jgi:hypothetical protein